MLTSPILKNDPFLEAINIRIGDGGPADQIEPGIYVLSHHNFGNSVANIKNAYPHSEDYRLRPYGVCDNLDQVRVKYAEWFNDPERKYCIAFCPVHKSEEPDSGGWRWHKWGEYIGTKNPQCEYIYDEGEDIQTIYCYHIWELY